MPTSQVNNNVTWSSSNAAVATVSNTGTVTAVAPGTATITVTANEGSFTYNVGVTVIDVPVTGITLNHTTFTLDAGDTKNNLTATISPPNATNKNVTWSSSNAAVATVSNTGTVTAVAAGTAVISVTTADGNFTAIANVTVIPTHTHAWGDWVRVMVSGVGTNVTRRECTVSGCNVYQTFESGLPAHVQSSLVVPGAFHNIVD